MDRPPPQAPSGLPRSAIVAALRRGPTASSGPEAAPAEGPCRQAEQAPADAKATPMAQTTSPGPFFERVPRAHPAEQPFSYPLQREWAEPDWRRLPGFRDVTRTEWETAQWQRAHTVKNLRQLQAVYGDLFPADLLASIERDQAERATMSMLLPPQMLNTMDERDLWADPVRRYMLPALDDRDAQWPSHPLSTRDSLHEADMWAVEGLTHRYPTKVLAELLPTCPQYCGHCTRMDLVGNSTPLVNKHKFTVKPPDRHGAMLDYLRRTPPTTPPAGRGGPPPPPPPPPLRVLRPQLHPARVRPGLVAQPLSRGRG